MHLTLIHQRSLVSVLFGTIQTELDSVWIEGTHAWMQKHIPHLYESIACQEVLLYRELKLAEDGRSSYEDLWSALVVWRDLLLTGLADHERVLAGGASSFGERRAG